MFFGLRYQAAWRLRPAGEVQRVSVVWVGSRDWRKRAKNPRIPSKYHRNPIEAPSKPLRNITLTIPELHRSNTAPVRPVQATRKQVGTAMFRGKRFRLSGR